VAHAVAQGLGRLARAAGLLLAALAVASCATSRPQPAGVLLDDGARAVAVAALRDFRFVGRVAVAAGEQGFNATLDWRQRGADTELQLRAPLGFGSARVLYRDGQWQLSTSQGHSLAGEAARHALQQQLGFELPLDLLRYWVLGLPLPEALLPEAAAWQIDYPAWREAAWKADRIRMPQRLTASREGLRLKLLVEDWQLGPR
jgi:outer membrane lipoprotein LolB